MNQENSPRLGHPVEIMAIEKGRCTEPGPMEGVPMALLTLRPHPEENYDHLLFFMLTAEQCVRLRDTLNVFLNDRDSWMHLPKEQQRAMSFERRR